MTNYEYACWVRGFLQLCPDIALDKRKVQILKNHLNLVTAVEGKLGEKNQLLYHEIIEVQSTPNEKRYAQLKTFLLELYFDNTEQPA